MFLALEIDVSSAKKNALTNVLYIFQSLVCLERAAVDTAGQGHARGHGAEGLVVGPVPVGAPVPSADLVLSGAQGPGIDPSLTPAPSAPNQGPESGPNQNLAKSPSLDPGKRNTCSWFIFSNSALSALRSKSKVRESKSGKSKSSHKSSKSKKEDPEIKEKDKEKDKDKEKEKEKVPPEEIKVMLLAFFYSCICANLSDVYRSRKK
jgi:hypothetical protein